MGEGEHAAATPGYRRCMCVDTTQTCDLRVRVKLLAVPEFLTLLLNPVRFARLCAVSGASADLALSMLQSLTTALDPRLNAAAVGHFTDAIHSLMRGIAYP